ncbi:hypothetical protein D3C71_1061360 [compost metagenome]
MCVYRLHFHFWFIAPGQHSIRGAHNTRAVGCRDWLFHFIPERGWDDAVRSQHGVSVYRTHGHHAGACAGDGSLPGVRVRGAGCVQFHVYFLVPPWIRRRLWHGAAQRYRSGHFRTVGAALDEFSHGLELVGVFSFVLLHGAAAVPVPPVHPVHGYGR